MPVPLPGPIGDCIKKRLESAAIRIGQLDSWESLRCYLLQDSKWEHDDDILLQWQEDITVYFLERCRIYQDPDKVEALALALKDGQQLEAGTGLAEDACSVEENSEHDTVTPADYSKVAELTRAIFLVSWENKTRHGVKVDFKKDAAMSKISEKVVLDRWALDDEIFEKPIVEGVTHRTVRFINLTWERPAHEGATIRQSTTFEVVSDEDMDTDVEFGRNVFGPVYNDEQRERQSERRSERQSERPSEWQSERQSGRQTIGHSSTKSLPTIESSKDARGSASRSQAGGSPSGRSHRRQTAPSTTTRSGRLSREEFIERRMIVALRTKAEIEYEEYESTFSDVDQDDDAGSYASSKGKQHSSLNTTISSKRGVHTDRWKR